RLEDQHARHARDVRHRLGQLDVHLLQRLLDVLDRLGRVADEHLPLPQIAAQHTHFVGRPKRWRQQAVTVQPLDPLTIAYVRLGTARYLTRLPGIDQEYFEAAPLQQLEQGHPIDSG